MAIDVPSAMERKRHHLWVHIGVVAGKRQRREVDRLRTLRSFDGDPVVTRRHLGSCIAQLAHLHPEVLGNTVADGDLAAGHRSGEDVGSRFEAIGNDTMVGRVQLGYAVDHNGRGSRTLDVGAHLTQVGRKVGKLGFPGCVADRGRPVCEHGSKKDVLGGADRRELEVDLCTVEPVRGGGTQHAVLEFEDGTEILESTEMEVDRPRAEVVTTRERDSGFTRAGKECAEDEDRRAHLSDEIERRFGVRVFGDGDLDRGPAPLTGRTDMPQDVAHDLDVENPRNVREAVDSRRQQRCDHVLERSVLRTEHREFPFERGPSHDAQHLSRDGHGVKVREGAGEP